VPELAVALSPGGPRLVFRWYKVTSDQKTAQWVEALCDGSRQAPLAIIGGSSSDAARELAMALQEEVEARGLNTAPLLLLTTATADHVPVKEGVPEEPLNWLHKGRTFRFCFTNRQMAAAITEFIWGRAELRPDAGPFYLVRWEDDSYSKDLSLRFRETIGAWEVAGWLALTPGTGGLPLNLTVLCSGDFREPFETVDYSVGGFDQPNRWEKDVVQRMMEMKTIRHAGQKRPLLVLTAASSQPARRFLRGLARIAPVEARRFVVATGDAIAFNTIYRDRNVAWPIQDLPYDLIFFCHRDPVDPDAGFRAEEEARAQTPDAGSPATGTEDLLLYRDIVEAVVRACHAAGAAPANGDELARRLRQARWQEDRIALDGDGPLLFDADGNRQSGTGEHIVWLRPTMENGRALPQAWIEVWPWRGPRAGRAPAVPSRALRVEYDVVSAGR
jgi:hypothetical protein